MYVMIGTSRRRSRKFKAGCRGRPRASPRDAGSTRSSADAFALLAVADRAGDHALLDRVRDSLCGLLRVGGSQAGGDARKHRHRDRRDLAAVAARLSSERSRPLCAEADPACPSSSFRGCPPPVRLSRRSRRRRGWAGIDRRNGQPASMSIPNDESRSRGSSSPLLQSVSRSLDLDPERLICFAQCSRSVLARFPTQADVSVSALQSRNACRYESCAGADFRATPISSCGSTSFG